MSILTQNSLDYSRQCRESGRKPHSYSILIEYCFSPIKWMKKELLFVVKLRWSKSQKYTTKEPFMSIVNTLALKSNRQIKINFDVFVIPLRLTKGIDYLNTIGVWTVTKSFKINQKIFVKSTSQSLFVV